MLDQIQGLHHVTSLASDTQANNDFFTKALGLRRVKKTVNFDNPHVYHLYYGDALGTPGTVMTYFPHPGSRRGIHGTGEVGSTAFAVPPGTLAYWQDRLAARGATDLRQAAVFGQKRLQFNGPDGEELALVETEDARLPWSGGGVAPDKAIRGFHSVSLRLGDAGETIELLRFMGYAEIAREGDVTRFALPGGNGAEVIDIDAQPETMPAEQGAGAVHHIAFAVENRDRQAEVREALMSRGHKVTPVIDRDYFWAIYFRAPGGVLFEVATNEPGFDRDEDRAHLGEALRLPAQHAHLRDELLARYLAPIED